MDQHAKDLCFEVIELARTTPMPIFYDWKDFDDWLFSNLSFTKAELAEIYDGRGVMVYTAAAI